MFGPDEEEQVGDKRNRDSEETPLESKKTTKKPKTHHKANVDKTASATILPNQDATPAEATLADVNPADLSGTDGQTVVTNKSSPAPWRKVDSRPPLPTPTEYNQRRVIQKALDNFFDVHDHGELAALISGKINDFKTQDDNNSITSAFTPAKPTLLLDQRPLSPDFFPCSPAYPPAKAVVDYQSHALNTENL